ncbi:MAG: FAD-binding oxidoreductase [Rhodobacteraceae bacterium]|nr:FAD-binding oxidoreductase [Paracoccaceae bacterium]
MAESLQPATQEFARALRGALPQLRMPPFDERFGSEPRGLFTCADALVVAPSTVDQVSVILSMSHEAGVPVIPFGGGTGLVGGQVSPDLDRPLVVSLHRLRAVRKVDVAASSMTVEAGVTLQEVRTAAAGAGFRFPLSIASKGSCNMGGVMATNAGGVNVLRFGNARDLCLGVEAVLADGSVLDGLNELPKDNSGFDLKHLLIGSEGTLAIITAARIRLFPAARDRATALLTLTGLSAASELCARCKEILPDQLSAFELINRIGLEFLVETGLRRSLPMRETTEWLVLIDVDATQPMELDRKLFDVAESAQDAGLVADGVFAHSESQRKGLWMMRELIPEANSRIGAIASHDISIPIQSIVPFVEAATERLNGIGPFRVNCFGHFGDGNLHYNVFPPAGESRRNYMHLRDRIVGTVHALVREFGGSTAAEHGCGRLKAAELQLHGDATRLATMHSIKRALDPRGIMNPGVIFRLPRMG